MFSRLDTALAASVFSPSSSTSVVVAMASLANLSGSAAPFARARRPSAATASAGRPFPSSQRGLSGVHAAVAAARGAPSATDSHVRERQCGNRLDNSKFSSLFSTAVQYSRVGYFQQEITKLKLKK